MTPAMRNEHVVILLAEDDDGHASLIQRNLKRAGFVNEIVRVRDGQEALDYVRGEGAFAAHPPDTPLLLLLDINMPLVDGVGVLKAIRADPKLVRLPVIMLTMMDDKRRGYALGAANYITKPVDRKLLAQILTKYRCPHAPCPVLVVDDDATTRQMMRSMLEKAGWSVREAENGRIALERVAEDRPALILLDLMMPEMDGFAFAAELHRHAEWRTIPIIVLTARDLTAEDLVRLNGNVHSVLDKGHCTREELMLQVRDLLAGWTTSAPSEREAVDTLV